MTARSDDRPENGARQDRLRFHTPGLSPLVHPPGTPGAVVGGADGATGASDDGPGKPSEQPPRELTPSYELADVARGMRCITTDLGAM
jgi:hypothetical protein